MSAAKYAMHLALTAAGVDITTEQVQQMNMQTLRTLLAQAHTQNTQSPATTEDNSEAYHSTNGHHNENGNRNHHS